MADLNERGAAQDDAVAGSEDRPQEGADITDVLTQHVIDALTELGLERRAANGSYALYTHPAGASVSIPHMQPRLSGALLKATERQVTGFGIASAHAFAEKVRSFREDADGTTVIDAGPHEKTGQHTAPRRRIAAN